MASFQRDRQEGKNKWKLIKFRVSYPNYFPRQHSSNITTYERRDERHTAEHQL